MSRELSPKLLAQIFAESSDDPFLALFTLTHPSWSEIIYLVNNTESVTSNGNVFEPFPVRLTLPVDDGESIRKVTIELDNVSQELIEEIRSVTDTNIDVTIELVLASDPDVVELDITGLSIKSVDYDATAIRASLYLDDFLNTEITSEKYNTTNFPGIFT